MRPVRWRATSACSVRRAFRLCAFRLCAFTPPTPALERPTSASVREPSSPLGRPGTRRGATVHPAPRADAHAPRGIAIHDDARHARGAPLRPAARATTRAFGLRGRSAWGAVGVLGATSSARVEAFEESKETLHLRKVVTGARMATPRRLRARQFVAKYGHNVPFDEEAGRSENSDNAAAVRVAVFGGLVDRRVVLDAGWAPHRGRSGNSGYSPSPHAFSMLSSRGARGRRSRSRRHAGNYTTVPFR